MALLDLVELQADVVTQQVGLLGLAGIQLVQLLELLLRLIDEAVAQPALRLDQGLLTIKLFMLLCLI